MRTLEDMKRDRGGICHRCGKDIMSPLEEDHTYCNDCWLAMLRHTYEEYTSEDGEVMCNYCEKDEGDIIHQMPRDKALGQEKFNRILGF